MDRCIIWPRGQCLALKGDGLGRAPLILTGICEIGERPEVVGIDPHGALEGGQGLIRLTLGIARQAQVVLGVHQVRPEL